MGFEAIHNVDISHILVEILNKLQQLMSNFNSDYDEFFTSIFSSN